MFTRHVPLSQNPEELEQPDGLPDLTRLPAPLSPIRPQPSPGKAAAPPSAGDAALMQAARKLEASFLSEMLGHAGFGAARKSFGGGVGEEQFSSFLRQAQADSMVKHGGIGLAEHLFEALKERAK